MSQIDTSQWKEFKVGKLFDFYRGKEAAPKRVPEGNIPMINETQENNGVAKQADSEHVFPGNSITVSVNYASTVFYQPKDFCASVNIIILHNDYLNDARGKFIAAMLSKYNQRFSYTNKISQQKLKEIKLPLPVDYNGDPDWQYMDTYIAKLTALAHKNVSSLKQTKAKPTKLNIDHWNEFKLSELFEPEFTDGDNKVGQLEEADTGVNLIGPLNSNNGILGKFISNTKIFPKNTLTWDMFGTCYWQKEPYQTVSHGHVLVLNPKVQINSASLLYLATILTKLGHQKQFGYTNMLTINKYNKLYIKLPIDAKGEPDWEYMDNQVRHLATLSDLTITSLDPAKLPIFIGEWKEFKIEKLFTKLDTKSTRKHTLKSDLAMKPTKDQTLPLIYAKKDNNGIMYYDNPKYYQAFDHCISIIYNGAVAAGLVFPQINKVGVLAEAYLIKPKTKVLDNVLFFLATIVQQVTYHKYSRDNLAVWSKVKNDYIKLPVDFNGNPDWQYMDQYISWIKQYSKHKLTLIQ